MNLIPWRPKKKSVLATYEPAAERATSAVINQQGAAEKFKITSIVADGMTIHGPLEVQESVMILGTVNGDVAVRQEGMTMLCRQPGRINGSVQASTVMLSGEVNGDIDAQFVRLFPTARVSGRIRASRLIVDDGAVILNESLAVGNDSKPVEGITSLSPQRNAAPLLNLVRTRDA